MKLRNKKTGEIVDLSEGFLRDTYNGEHIQLQPVAISHEGYLYSSLAALNEEWEDYEPKDPLIGDEATAKFVRAWAKHWGFEVVTAHIYTGSVELVGWTEPSTRGREIDILGGFVSGALEEGKDYTIDELCGEEE